MSASHSIRSYGDAYFAVGTPAAEAIPAALCPTADLSAAYAGLYLDLAVHALPEVRSSGAEAHPLFSFHQWGPSAIDLCYFGLTPNGSLIGYNVSRAGTLSSVAGTVVADGVFRKYAYLFSDADDKFVDWRFNTRDGDPWTLGSTVYKSGTYTGATSTLEVGTRNGVFMLFNGRLGNTRCRCSIRSAIFAATTHTVWWPINEGRLLSVAGDITTYTTSPPTTPDVGLDIMYYNAASYGIVSVPFGAVPSTPVGQSFRWDIHTPYSRQSRPSTVYTRVAA